MQKISLLRARARCLAWCAVAVLASACGGSTDSPTPGSGGTAIWPSNATGMVVRSEGGGFVPTPPAGSECQSGAAQYTLTVATRHFEWQECRTLASPYTLTTGDRVLSPAEADGLIDALLAISPSSATGCGADKASVLLQVTEPGGQHEYLDDFYACNHAGSYVSGLDALFQAASNLAN